MNLARNQPHNRVAALCKTAFSFALALSLPLSLVSCTEGSTNSDEVVVISHRGNSSDTPEHTFAGYDKVIEQGSHYIEQDLVLTDDDVLVVSHDKDLERTTGKEGRIVDLSFSQIRNEYTAPNGEKIHSIQEVFERYGNSVNYVSSSFGKMNFKEQQARLYSLKPSMITN